MRLANGDDLDMVFGWRNLDWVIALSAAQHVVTKEEHTAWFTKVLGSAHLHLLFIVETLLGEAIGILRFDREKNQASVSIYLLPEFQGQGRGMHALRLGCERVFAQWNDLTSVRATVRSDNAKSLKAFREVGFTDEKEGEEHGVPVHFLFLRRS